MECKIRDCYNESEEGSNFCSDHGIEEDDDKALRDEWGMDDEEEDYY